MTIIREAPDPFKTFECTDAGNADRLCAQYGSRLKYSHEEKCWFVWTGKVWKHLPDEQMYQVATKVARDIANERHSDATKQLELVKWSKKAQSKERLSAMIELSKAQVEISSKRFDRSPWLLNCTNGTLDLQTGTLRPHDPNDYITALITEDYDSNAKCERFKKYLHEVFARNAELIAFVQRAIGYSLTGSVREECLFLMFGKRRNGKGTLTNTISKLLGPYARTIDFASLLAKKNYTGPRDDIANMKGRRFVTAHENKEGGRLEEDIIKLLTGGDTLSARKLYQNSVEIAPTWKIWLSVNHLPVASATDEAIWTRLMVIPFDISFAGNEDKGLKDELLLELPGIFAWAVEGCRDYLKQGLNPPECVEVSREQYRTAMNPLTEFVEEECVLEDGAAVLVGKIYKRYLRYCDSNAVRNKLGRSRFSRLLAMMGFERGRARNANGDRTFVGIRLRPSDASDRTPPESLSGSNFLPEDSLQEELSESQEYAKPMKFEQIPVCPVCGSDTFWRRSAVEGLFCQICSPPGRDDEVLEYVAVAVQVELDLEGDEL